MSFKEMDIYREEEVIFALRRALGNTTIAAADLNVSRGQLMDYIAMHDSVKLEKLQLKEALIDKAEQILVTKMESSDALLMFFLRTQAKHRGYSSDVTVSGPNGGPINVNLNARALIASLRKGFEDATSKPDQEDGNLLDG